MIKGSLRALVFFVFVAASGAIGSEIYQRLQVDSLGSGDAKGLSITGNKIKLHAATATQPGAVSTTTQTFAGDKTFSGATTLMSGALTVSGTVNVSSGEFGQNNIAVLKVFNTATATACNTTCAAAGDCMCVASGIENADTTSTCSATTGGTQRTCMCLCDDF